MKEKTHFMAHQPSVSAKPDDEVPSQIRPPCQSQDSESDHKDETESQAQNLWASETCVCDREKMALPAMGSDSAEESGREKLKRHRGEVAGRVWIPEIWGQEELLKDWIDCSAFDAPLVPSRIMTARAALVREGTRANAEGFRIENRICAKLESAKSQ
ncbi:protein BIC1 [Neltuma alba]|uniref:protein BIC1 n=1 Tax=Neltuma alba TaxID=207710 RepID=UPI0010A5311B|nr:protein BIC1-like [Prosopis alba]